jgi:translation initiation factor 2B subunit (eIF-2B alpha/beta/delta family)
MREFIEQRIKERQANERNLVEQIGQREKQLVEIKATLISVRGGIIELNGLLKALDDDGTDVSEQVAIIREASDKLKEIDEEE